MVWVWFQNHGRVVLLAVFLALLQWRDETGLTWNCLIWAETSCNRSICTTVRGLHPSCRETFSHLIYTDQRWPTLNENWLKLANWLHSHILIVSMGKRSLRGTPEKKWKIAAGWSEKPTSDTPYQLFKWNCSAISQILKQASFSGIVISI